MGSSKLVFLYPSKTLIVIWSKMNRGFHRCRCERKGIVGGDEGPVGGVAQVVCHRVKVVGVHGEEGQEKDGEVRGEVKGEVEENQGQPLMCMA